MIKKIIPAILLLACFSMTLFPIMYANHGECFFIESECGAGISLPTSTADPGSSLGDLIVSGACSYSSFLAYLKEYEAGRSDQKESLDKAYEAITAANTFYKKLTRESAGFPYNEPAVSRLKQFDYESYAKTLDLVPRVFNQVRVLLAKGDVRGVFQEIAWRTQSIADKLGPAAMNSVPGDIELWRLSQAYAETLLFGQYAAEIFERCR
jgi:hypothetical protein